MVVVGFWVRNGALVLERLGYPVVNPWHALYRDNNKIQCTLAHTYLLVSSCIVCSVRFIVYIVILASR